MIFPTLSTLSTCSIFLLAYLPDRVAADQILKTSGFSSCLTNSSVSVQRSLVEYNNDNKQVTFDLAGTSSKAMNVTAELLVTAYGVEVYKNNFNPCAPSTFVSQLCPVPAGTFAAKGVQTIPESYASMIPAIAFTVPDIAAEAKIQLKSLDTGSDIACITSTVNNGKTVNVPSIPYVAAGIAGAALALTGVSALGAIAGGGSAAGGGAGTISPSFTEVIGWFQGMAMNGMMSANLPPIYRSFTKNFAFSTGLVPMTAFQQGIDDFRGKTGGNLSANSVALLQNTTLVFDGGSSATATKVKRALMSAIIYARDELSTSVNNTSAVQPAEGESLQKTVSGITAYAEQLMVPKTNVFMTILAVAAVVIAAIVVGILLFKVILEGWALFGNFPKSLSGFREHYWTTMARTIVNLILVLYGVWVLYCIFQFTNGDSIAAQVLAGVSLGLFTAVLAYFVFMIFKTARELKRVDGDTSALYDDKAVWLKFSIFYDSYKKDVWWLFLPVIIYMLAKGIILAGLNGKGLPQAIGQLIVEALMLGLLVWHRPFERKSGNVINIIIQVVRVLSVVCILVFVEELGFAQTTQTVTGIVLITVQSVLTGVLAILIAVNAIILCCRENPHRKRRKELEKMNREVDNLTPLDARNSLLLDPTTRMNTTANSNTNTRTTSSLYSNDPKFPFTPRQETRMEDRANPYSGQQQFNPQHRQLGSVDSQTNLVGGAAPLGGRAPTPPDMGRLVTPNYGQYPNYGQNQYGGGNGGYRGLAY